MKNKAKTTSRKTNIKKTLNKKSSTPGKNKKKKVSKTYGTKQKLKKTVTTRKEDWGKIALEWQITFDAVSDAICLLDKDQRIIRCNRAMSKMFGFSRNELIGRFCWEIVHDTKKPIPNCPVIRSKKSLKREEMELQINGKIFNVTAYPALINKRNLVAIVHIIRDITENKKREEKLKEAEAEFRTIFNAASDGILLACATDKNIIAANDKIFKMLGYSQNELLKMNISDLLPKESLPYVLNEFNMLSKKRKWTARDIPFIKKNKTILFFDVTAAPALLKGEKCLIGIFRDATERRKIEEDLRQSRESYKKLFEDHAAIKLIIDLQTDMILDANHSAANFYGWTRDELKKMKIQQINTLSPKEIRQEMNKAFKEKRFHFEFCHRRADGSIRDVDVFSSKIEMNGRNVLHSIIQDITKRKLTEKALRDNEEHLRSITQNLPGVVFQFYAKDTGEYGVNYISEPSIEYAEFSNKINISDLDTLVPGFVTLLHEEDREKFFSSIKTAVETLTPWNFEGRVVLASGNLIWIQGMSTPTRLKDRVVFDGIILDITERKKSEEDFRLLAENAPDAIFIRTQMNFAYLNNEALKLFGAYSPEQLIGKPVMDRIHPDALDMVRERIRLLDENKMVIPLTEQKYVKLDGTTVDVEVSGVPFIYEGCESSLIFVRDITERKKAEKSLILIKKAVESSSEAIGMSDPKGHHFYHNKAFSDLFEYTPEELAAAGEGPTAFANKDVARDVFDAIMRGDSWSGETEMVSKSGKIFPVLLRADAIKDESGKIIGLIGLHTDITERKKVEDALRESEKKYKLIAEKMTDVVWIQNMDLQLIYITPSIQTVLGFSPEEYMMKTIEEQLTPESVTIAMETLAREIAIEKRATDEPSRVVSLEFEHYHKNGSTRWLESVITWLRDDQGVVTGLYGMSRDITKRKLAEDEIRKLNESLEKRVLERTAELEAFSYSVSHDLRAPLRTITGFGKALMEDYKDKLDPHAKDYLSRIRTATDTMTELIEDMLKLFRITRTEMDVIKVNLSSIAQTIMDDLRNSQPQRLVNINIAKSMEDSADPRLIRIVLENLLGNAWKFTEKQVNAEIEFSLRKMDNKKVYFIRDNGAGFEMEYAYKLFAPFQRLHNFDEYPGTGIGLAIVQRIVYRHGGKVWVEAEVDKGATVFFTLAE